MLNRVAAFFDAEGIAYVSDDRSVSTGFDDVAITVLWSGQQLLVSARYREPFKNLTKVNQWNVEHPNPTAFVLGGELYFKAGLALADPTDDQLGFFLASALGSIGSACEWFAQWK
ncbi:YbjN domain-containing protein [Corynebacterium hindlerae]|uniref:YbjN domain-containing protein n=1 Tax=Corynebacterium hindlerae TaxID=699041 RepID=UPI001AD77D14|nr:YbjN domain-containing protein [Corynebacterium hindlerae]QTH58731.1 YbjN domain-containing protein [Corynebacterium hindlerae]